MGYHLFQVMFKNVLFFIYFIEHNTKDIMKLFHRDFLFS